MLNKANGKIDPNTKIWNIFVVTLFWGIEENVFNFVPYGGITFVY